MKKIQKVLLLLVAVGFLVSLSSCSTLDGFDDMGTIIIDNQSDDTIFFLYISSANSMDWGDDVMEDDVIEPGDAYYLNVPSGYYDVQFANFFNIELDSFYDQIVLPGKPTRITYN
ncbi:MAG: hypothetical protein HQ557_18670 [Bacteroidetes bacterium]|nr:hypothetical protein [Bacteroidota bacterium]